MVDRPANIFMAYPEFQVPDSYILPEQVQEGETFEDICTLRVKANGKVCLEKIGDAPIYSEDGKKDEEPEDYGTESGMESRVTEAFKNRG